MSKKFLRPPPQYDDSEEDSDDDEVLSDDDDDDDDDDEDDDSLPEANNDKKRSSNSIKKGNDEAPAKKKPKTMNFFDMEAEASDDDEDAADGNHAANRDGEQMDEEAREIMRQQDRRRAQAGQFGERSVQEMAKDIEHRHRLQHRTVDRSRILDRPEHRARPIKRDGGRIGGLAAKSSAGRGSMEREEDVPLDRDEEGGPEVYTAVAQQSLVPSVADPSLWMVSCLTGKEQELVFQIMNKCVAFARQGSPLGICGAIAAQSKGKIYIESFSEPAVNEAINGIRGVMAYSMRLIPINDMTTVMTVQAKKKPVKKNEWVRMTRGHYKGDLALVKAVKESGLKCVVQCVPRLDLTLLDLPPEEARVRRRTVRPAQKFFNPQEVAALGGNSLRRQRFPGLDTFTCDYFEGNYYHDGYLLKEMTVGSMIKPLAADDQPALDELQGFQRRKAGKDDDNDGTEDNEGSKMAASLLDELSALQGNSGMNKSGAPGGGLFVGDTVEVIEGDLIGMRGKLMSLDGATVKVRPNNTTDLGGTDQVEFLANQVRKYIPVGVHVKITDGRYANETGTVVAVEQVDGETDFTAVILTDITSKEISVRTIQVRESAEVASGQDKLSGYELYDLVVLSGGGSANEVGVIVRVGREDFTVINNHGIAREVRPEELRGKRNSTSNRAVALDAQGNQLRVNDSVKVAEGPHKGKAATIKRMSRAQLFLHSQTRSEHAGIFVVRSRSCVLAGSRSQSRGGGGSGGASSFGAQQSHANGGRGGRGRKDDSLIGKSVRIQAGQWKGYLGTVCDATATHVQVELHSRLKKVMVVRDRVLVVGDKFGATNGDSSEGQAAAAAAVTTTMATPMHAVGGATPAIHGFGGATPAHDSETTDEVWRPGGAIDQDNTAESAKDDGWGSTSNDAYGQNNNDDNDDGWGSSSGAIASTWGSQPKEEPASGGVQTKQESNAGATVKREQPKSEMETEMAEDEESPVWFMERVCVKLKSNDKPALIKEINADKSAVVELEDKSTTTVRASDVTMVPPKEHDTVLVAGGTEIGLEGTMVCVDGSDAILKDANDDFKIIDFVHLVKISSLES